MKRNNQHEQLSKSASDENVKVMEDRSSVTVIGLGPMGKAMVSVLWIMTTM